MRYTRFGKLTALVVLGITSYVVTSMLMTPGGTVAATPPVAEASQDPPPSTDVVTQVDGNFSITFGAAENPPNGAPDDAADSGYRPIVSGGNGLSSVQVHGNTVHIKGTGTVRESRSDMKYIWAVRVLDPDDHKTQLFEKLYFDHILTVPESNELDEEFEDELEIPLEAGKYDLQFTWYAIPPDSGEAGLSDPDMRELHRAPGVTRPITLGQ
jgi:hypothetical protein